VVPSISVGAYAQNFAGVARPHSDTCDALYRDRNEKHRLVSGQRACPCNVRYIVQDVIYELLLGCGTINSERGAASVHRLSIPVQDIVVVQQNGEREIDVSCRSQSIVVQRDEPCDL
jgi:hypothetical protein